MRGVPVRCEELGAPSGVSEEGECHVGRVAELLGFSPPFRSDSVLSLVSLDQSPLEHAEQAPGAFRPFAPA